MLWLNFLHFYQPANADASHIRLATERSYLRIIRALEEHPRLRLTANLSGCLIERWLELGETGLISRLGRLVRSGRLELVGSAAYHPLLPLLPAAVARRQIEAQATILRAAFGRSLKLRGFYLPELAYSPAVSRLVKQAGYEWLILDETAVSSRRHRPLAGRDRNSGLMLIFRSRRISDAFPPDWLARNGGRTDRTIITATDAELYGLRHIDHTAEFESILKKDWLATETMSAWLDRQTDLPAFRIKPHDWTSRPADIRAGRAFLLWNDPGNKLHARLWQLARLAWRTIDRAERDPNRQWALWHLDRGLASCSWWWASGHDFRRHFGPLAWDPEAVERGTGDLVRSIRSLSGATSLTARLMAEQRQAEILRTLWQTHWRRFDRRPGVGKKSRVK